MQPPYPSTVHGSGDAQKQKHVLLYIVVIRYTNHRNSMRIMRRATVSMMKSSKTHERRFCAAWSDNHSTPHPSFDDGRINAGMSMPRQYKADVENPNDFLWAFDKGPARLWNHAGSGHTGGRGRGAKKTEDLESLFFGTLMWCGSLRGAELGTGGSSPLTDATKSGAAREASKMTMAPPA